MYGYRYLQSCQLLVLAFVMVNTHNENMCETRGKVLKNGPRREKTCLRGFANNTGADQPAHTRSLISAFVIRFK